MYGLNALNASSGDIGNRWLWLFEAAVLSCSRRSEDIFESISLLLFEGTTLVEFSGIPPVCPDVLAAGIDDELLFELLAYKEPGAFGPD